jgi:hypothetical protein
VSLDRGRSCRSLCRDAEVPVAVGVEVPVLDVESGLFGYAITFLLIAVVIMLMCCCYNVDVLLL